LLLRSYDGRRGKKMKGHEQPLCNFQVFIRIFLVILLVGAGCAATVGTQPPSQETGQVADSELSGGAGEEQSEEAVDTTGEESMATTSEEPVGVVTAEVGPVPVYYDFPDILIPTELSLDRKKSFVYTTPSLAAGVLVLEGYVDAASLVDFFNTNMPKDGWILKSSFRYRRSILNFEKEERSCLINVAEYPLRTQVEIWVAPQVPMVVP
jgi:hypothetical protein